MVYQLHMEESINKDYFNKEVNDAVKEISKYGDFEWFVADDSGESPWQSLIFRGMTYRKKLHRILIGDEIYGIRKTV